MTGVQTCALPIWESPPGISSGEIEDETGGTGLMEAGGLDGRLSKCGSPVPTGTDRPNRYQKKKNAANVMTKRMVRMSQVLSWNLTGLTDNATGILVSVGFREISGGSGTSTMGLISSSGSSPRITPSPEGGATSGGGSRSGVSTETLRLTVSRSGPTSPS